MQGNRNHLLIIFAVLGGALLLTRVSLTGGNERVTTLSAASASATAPPPVHVDSARPIEEELRLFREAIGGPATELTGGASSRDELVRLFLDGLERQDLTALRALHLTAEEFAYLYYPYTRYTAPPYELAPGIVWLQLEGFGLNNLQRAINRVGGKPLGPGYRCPAEPVARGEARFWDDCLVTVPDGEDGTTELKLFSEIMEFGGRYKFVSYGNGL